MRTSGIALALGLIASAAGIDAHAATGSATALEQQYEAILQLPSAELMQQELARLFASNPDHPALQPALEGMVQVAQLLVPPPAPVGATDASAGGDSGGGSEHATSDVLGPY